MTTKIAGTLLTIAGLEEITAGNAGQFQRRACAALDGHAFVEVDLSQTKAMDCGGLGALIAVRNLAHGRNASLRLVGATPAVRLLFDAVRAGDLFEIANVKAHEHPSFVSAAVCSRLDLSALSAVD